MGRKERPPGPETICAHLGEDRSAYEGAVVPPIYQNSLFTRPSSHGEWDPGVPRERYAYTRVSNPTTAVAEAKLAALEHGARSRCFSSGMGAISAAILSCVRSADHVVSVETVYGPTRAFLSDYLGRFGVTCTFVDGGDIRDVEAAVRPTTRLIYVESPSSVVFKQQDLQAVAELARSHGAATICDNSWATPIFQNPLDFGIDLVVHSASKYLGGHSDIVAGVVVGSSERITAMAGSEGGLLGGVLDPFASWLLIRGLRTLPIRMERHQNTARLIACELLEHRAVAGVHYPGLPNDPQAGLTGKQLRGTSGLLSLELRRQDEAAAPRFMDALRYFGIGCSWGGFESLVTTASVPASRLGRDDRDTITLVRLSIGLETADDLLDDLGAALAEL